MFAHDDCLVRHRRHVGAPRRARAHHHRDLRNARRGQVRLVEEDTAEMLAVRKDLVLAWQIGTSRIHQVDAGKPVGGRNLLGAQVLLHRDRIVAAALHRGVVAHHHAFPPGHATDAGDDAGARHLVAVHAPGRELRQFKKGRAGIQQRLDPVARQQLSAALVALAGVLPAAGSHARDLRSQVGDQLCHSGRVGKELCTARISTGLQDHQAVSLNSSRPISMRRISLVPAPISYSLASRSSRPVG